MAKPIQWLASEALGVDDIAFTVKRDVPLPFGFHLKVWLDWNPEKRGGNYGIG
ncbi:hypothetical protein ACCS92_05350 [Rhizobium ruizarguesonis]|uniref:hypothetical protein n=1 Tax=Rhizobium ruizarguesonis TaxID=2081791 RepID=UPI001FE19AB8|nr:hypothetical protein [Rhizobium ruizarguesonis]